MNKLFRAILLSSVVIFCVGCDQASKQIAKSLFFGAPTKSYFADTFRIQYAENRGAFLSMGNNLPENLRLLILQGGVALLLVGVVVYVLLKPGLSTARVVSFGLVVAGGFSNLIDRAANDGVVVDFLNLGIGSLRTGIFNFADVFIMAGALSLLFWRGEPQPDGKRA